MKEIQDNQRQGHRLETSYLAWRVSSAKLRQTVTERNKVYNERPRLRPETRH